jgi:hypothetical protein
MRIRLAVLALLAAAGAAWHEPHISITRAAIEALPASVRGLLAGEAENLAQLYSFYPDRYRNASPAEREYMSRFCELPGGRQIHNVTWDKAQDVQSVEYLFGGILAGLRAGESADVARYAGTLAHLIEDSLSPAHAMDLRLLQELVPPPEHARKLYIHAPMELSCPDFTLAGRTPRRLGTTVPEAARAVVDACYAGIRKNRGDLIELLQAVYHNDTAVMDRLRLKAARAAAEQYSDAMFTVLSIAREQNIPDPPLRGHSPRRTGGSGIQVQVSASNSTAPGRAAALNLAFALRETMRLLAVDSRVRRTELGRILIRVPAAAGHACVEVLGDWPPHAGSQVTDLCMNTAGNISSVTTRLDAVTSSDPDQRAFGQWIRTVDHRGDPLFELQANPTALAVKNHTGATASVTPQRRSFQEGVVLAVAGAAPVSVLVSEAESSVEVDVSGRPRETRSLSQDHPD